MVKRIVLFIILFYIGIVISHVTSPWSDEEYTMQNLKGYSYIQIIQGKLPEGCNEPLFYLIQKPLGSNKIFPILCTALTITLVFNLFVEDSLLMALISVILFLSCRIIWQHYAEIRPYSLILLLSTIQCLILHEKIEIKWLWLINILMAFVSSICIVPIVLSSAIVLIQNRIKTLWIIVIPSAIIIYYFTVSVYAGNLHNLPIFSNRYFIYLLPYVIINLLTIVEKGGIL